MPTHIAFLRAVNIGKRQYPMAELRAALVSAGFLDVATHIQTGNAVLSTPIRSRAKVEAELERLFAADRGFPVVTMVLSPGEVAAIAADCDELDAEHAHEGGHYVSLLKEAPTAAVRAAAEARSTSDERLIVRDRAAHLLLAPSFHESKLAGALESLLGPATSRNARVIRAVAAKWAS